jgi:hypothetical protein
MSQPARRRTNYAKSFMAALMRLDTAAALRLSHPPVAAQGRGPG